MGHEIKLTRKEEFLDEAPSYNFEENPKPAFLKDLNRGRLILGLRVAK